MANGIDWFRWHHGSVKDEKFKLVARRAGASVPDVIAVWAFILEKASASDVRGQFSDLDCEAVDCLFDFPATETRTADIIAAMEAGNLLTPNHVTRWDERQPKREREVAPPTAMTGAERAAKHRATKLALQQEDDQVTPSNATSRQVTPREEKSREEEITPKAKSKAESAPASRLPADWMPSDDDIEFCKTERPDLLTSGVADRFRDYWIAQPGVKGRKADWVATWRNWVRNERRGHSHGPPPPDKFDPTAYVNRNRKPP